MLFFVFDSVKGFKPFLMLLLFFLNSCNNSKIYIAKTHAHYHKVNKSYTIKERRYNAKSSYTLEERRYKPFQHNDLESTGYKEAGVASWYKNNGNKMDLTATGDFFNHNALTAAHRVLPFMSVVKVTNLKNKKSVNVIINDRGPFRHERIIDVSQKTAEILGFKKLGVTKVKIVYLPEETKKLLKRIKNKQTK